MNIQEAWIKAAIEKITLEIDYFSEDTKEEYTTREVEPDYYGWDTKHRIHGCWGFCRLRKGPRVFKEKNIKSWRYVGNSFKERPFSRSNELVEIYKSNKLAYLTWDSS